MSLSILKGLIILDEKNSYFAVKAAALTCPPPPNKLHILPKSIHSLVAFLNDNLYTYKHQLNNNSRTP